MKYYQEITLVSDEMPVFELWSKMYTQLHIALADLKNKKGVDSIGVSFPQYRYEEKNGKGLGRLGNKLRIFAPNESDLKHLNIEQWLDRLKEYVHIKSIHPVPANVNTYVTVRRIRSKSLERKAKDYAKYKSIGFDEAMSYCALYKKASMMDYPFIQMSSCDNGHCFKLSIFQEYVFEAVTGKFNTYGINNTASRVTVPHWE